MTESIPKMNTGVQNVSASSGTTAREIREIADLHEATFLAERLLVADVDLQRVREDALLDVSRVILERRIGLAPSEFIGSSVDDKLLYLKMCIEDWSVETSGVLLHDVHGRVLELVMIGKDTLNEVQLRARECIRQALRVNAAAVTLWHSHPSGTACPSRADLAHLANLVVVLENAGVALSDYMIVSPNETFSARSAGLLSFHAAMKLHEVSVPRLPSNQ